jgi:C-terminal processing protease CtpA/Prc
MKRTLGLCGSLLALFLTTGLVFGNSPTKTGGTTSGQSSKTASFGSSSGTYEVSLKNGKKKDGKKKPGKKSGKNKKNKKHHKKHHRKHHHKHHHHHHHHHHDHDRDYDRDRDYDYDRGYDYDWNWNPAVSIVPPVSVVPVVANQTPVVANQTPAVVVATDANDPEVVGDKGLLITNLEDGGPAMVAGLDVDDTILSVNGVRVQSVAELQAVLKKATGPVEVVFISDDSGDVMEVDVTPKNSSLGVTTEVVELEDAD